VEEITMLINPAFNGQRLRQLRRSRGLPAHRLAKEASVSTRHIWRLEAGTRPNVRAVTLARIALVLETSLDYLVGLTDDPRAIQQFNSHQGDNSRPIRRTQIKR